MRALDVWLYGRRAGRLEQIDGEVRFDYDDGYVAAGGPALSCSMPLDGDDHRRAASAFFANLLPEGEVRTLVARRLGVSAGNDFGLLYEIGGDCAGAVTLLPPGATEGLDAPGDENGLSSGPQVRWLDETGLAAALDELPSRPLLADPDEGVRLSLAGAQDKLPVVVRDGRIGIPLGRTPSDPHRQDADRPLRRHGRQRGVLPRPSAFAGAVGRVRGDPHRGEPGVPARRALRPPPRRWWPGRADPPGGLLPGARDPAAAEVRVGGRPWAG